MRKNLTVMVMSINLGSVYKAKEILEKRNKKIKESKKKKTRFYDLPGSVSVLSTSKQNRETENVIKAEEYRLGSKVRKAKEKAA